MLTPADWAGLCALTETNRPEEQEYVLWVIRNRAESPRFPETYEDVVLQRKQFSAFNAFTGEQRAHWPAERVFDEVATDHPPRVLLAAIHLAEKALAADDDTTQNPFVPSFAPPGVEVVRPDWEPPYAPGRIPPSDPRAVMHYYSPVSMKPAGSSPVWAKSAKLLFTPPGIDPARFVFAEAVP